MIKRRKQFLLFAAIAALAVLSGAAWAGITGGVLNSDNDDVDLSAATSYPGGDAKNPITLSGNLVNLTQNLTLGNPNVKGYAHAPLVIATEAAAGGAIFVGEGQTLNIEPVSGKSVSGSSNPQSSLRLFGSGTTNLSGSNNSYSVTFLQSGRLNVSSARALGDSDVTLAGGAVFGIVNGVGTLDLSAKPIYLTRYDANGLPELSVTFDTGTSASNSIKVGRLVQTTRNPDSSGTGNEIMLVKDGLGTLTISDVPEHSGGTVINAGTLELLAALRATQTIEISGDATLASGVNLLTNITIRPHSGAALSLPAITAEAALGPYETGEAALRLEGIDKTSLSSRPFLLKANLNGLRKPAGPDAESYYVKLLNSPSHGLDANEVTVTGILPVGFSPYYYKISSYVDSDNVYALLTKDDSAYSNIFDVTVFNSGAEQGNIMTVVVANMNGEPFASGAGFKYRFIDYYAPSSSDPLTSAIFDASKIQYNESRTKASFQIDLGNLTDENVCSHALMPGKNYAIAIDGTDDASVSTGLSTILLDSAGNVAEPETSTYNMDLEVSSDLGARTIKPSVTIYENNRQLSSTESKIVYFTLCDAFGDQAKISGVQTERTVYAYGGYAAAAFEKIPSGRYIVKVSSPEFAAVRYSGEIVIPGGGGGGGGCDAGAGIFAVSLLPLVSLFGKRKTILPKK